VVVRAVLGWSSESARFTFTLRRELATFSWKAADLKFGADWSVVCALGVATLVISGEMAFGLRLRPSLCCCKRR